MMKRLLVGVVLLLAISACKSGTPTGPSGTTTTTTTIPAVSNRNPVMNAMTVSPGFGISGLTAFSMSAAATDPDGDGVSLTWDFGDGTSAVGPAFSKTYGGSGVATVRVTATDGRGGSASDARTVTIGSMSGTWSGTLITSGTLSFTAFFTQSGAAVTGTMNLAGFNGRTDPVQPGTINSSGAITIRWKVNPFSDFTFSGQMDATGRRVTGTVAGSGFNGQPFTMDKQ